MEEERERERERERNITNKINLLLFAHKRH